jgi:hypothetical protein
LPFPEAQAAWEFDSLCRILQVTLDPNAPGTFLPSMAEHVSSFRRAQLRTVLFERIAVHSNPSRGLTAPSNSTSSSFSYIAACYQRAATLSAAVRFGLPRADHLQEDTEWIDGCLRAVAVELAKFAGSLLLEAQPGTAEYEFFHPTKDSHSRCVADLNAMMSRDTSYSRVKLLCPSCLFARTTCHFHDIYIQIKRISHFLLFATGFADRLFAANCRQRGEH